MFGGNHPPQTATSLAVVPEPVLVIIDPIGHLAVPLAQRADDSALRGGRQSVDQFRQPDAAGPTDDTGGDISRIVQFARQLALAEVTDIDPAIQTEVAGSPHPAHEADDLIVDEKLINELRVPGSPERELLVADAPKMLALLLAQR
jgi:hypothetical protein